MSTGTPIVWSEVVVEFKMKLKRSVKKVTKIESFQIDITSNLCSQD